jgi:hypothetical protein
MPSAAAPPGGAPAGFKIPILKEVGTTGLFRMGGYIFEEPLPELQGYSWRRILKGMIENDPVIGAMLFTIEMMARQATWKVVPASRNNEHAKAADFIKGALFEDMESTWQDTLSEIVTFLPWGYSYLEEVYKRRGGLETQDPLYKSKFSDGKTGWRKWSIRAQESQFRWEFDDAGGLLGMWQMPPPDFILRYVPVEKALHFRTTVRKGNPEGRSILRSAYTSWYYKNNISRIEGIGIERDLAGLPVAYVPPEVLGAQPGTDQYVVLQSMKQMIINVRRDEQEGLLFPLAYDEDGNQVYKFELVRAGGRRQFDTGQIINRYDQRMSACVLADFLLLGHEQVGSFALSKNKTEIFATAMTAWLDTICDVVNKDAIPRMMRLNAEPMDQCPKLTHGAVESVDLEELSDYVSKLSGAGISFTDPETQKYLKEAAHIPVPEDAAVHDQEHVPSDKVSPDDAPRPERAQAPQGDDGGGDAGEG